MIKIAKGAITFSMEDLLGNGNSAYVYEGRTKEGVAVAVKLFDKLTSKSKQGPYMRELAIYVKLGATTGNTCQMYGISPILYHGSGAGSFVLVMPVFTYTLGSLRLLRIDISDESLLSIMQQLVVILMYAHSMGVLHGDIHDENIMIKLNQVFLIDFDAPIKRTESYDMLKMFLEICGFFKLKAYLKEKAEKLGQRMARQKGQIIEEIISKKTMNSKYVRPLVDFCVEVVHTNSTNTLPDYRKLHGILEKALYSGQNPKEPHFFNWLSDEEIAAARKVPIGTIESIQFPAYQPLV